MGWLLEFNVKPPGNPLPSGLTVMVRHLVAGGLRLIGNLQGGRWRVLNLNNSNIP
jgi:hypothetical protein